MWPVYIHNLGGQLGMYAHVALMIFIATDAWAGIVNRKRATPATR